MEGEPTRYRVIYADCPWSFAVRSPKGEGRSATQHYACMPLADIKALPVRDMAEADACVFLWATSPMLPQALDVMQAWGFAYKTVAFTWAKRTKRDLGWFFGLGFWTRANPEFCLLGTRGSPKRIARDVPALVVAPVREHSRKPDEVRERIQRLVAGPYLELFARERAAGWSVACSDQPDLFGEAA